MAVTSPPTITALPTAPDRADRATFSARATAMFTALKDVFVGQVGAVATNVYNNAVDAAASASSASGSAVAAASSASAASSADDYAATATTQAGIATTQAGIATTQAGIAATKASDANASAIAALAVAASITGGPVTSVNGMTGVVTGLQAALVSGTNIKTVGGVSLLGSGDAGALGVGYGGTGVTTSTGTGAGVHAVNPSITGMKEVRVAVAASSIDLNTGNYFTKTAAGALSWTVTNVPAAGTAASFILDLTNGGTSTQTWITGTKWAGGTAPTLTASGRDVLGFFTHDGGTTWTGLLLGKDVR